MAFSIFQSGSSLYGMDQQGHTAALTLPTGITLDSTLRPRFTVQGNFAIMVNSPSRPITIDANLVVRPLTPIAPFTPLTLSGAAGGALSGTFLARQTFVIFDAYGKLIAESDFGPDTTAATITSQYLRAQGVNLSNENVSATRLYRTSSGTAVYFQWLDIDGNVQSEFRDDRSDAGLATFSAPLLGTPPDLAMIAEYKSRLFGVSKTDPNFIHFTDVARPYAWPADFQQPMPRLGSDNRGCTGFIRRRDALGLGRSNGLYSFTGTDDTNFRIVNVSENCGIEATDSVCVYRDVAFFLWKDGIYQWDVNGITNVCEGKVQRWFTRNGTFNLSRLKYAFAQIDPLRKKYRLYLASAGSNIENCWIEYDFIRKQFWGPHFSRAMNPSCAFAFSTDSGLSIPMVGGTDGFIRVDRQRRTDDDATGIDFDVSTAGHDVLMPLDEKYFGELHVSTKPQPRGTLDVYATVGDPDAPRFAKDVVTDEQHEPFQYDQRNSSDRLGRVGVGKACRLRFRNNEPGVDTVLRGYEVTPVHPTGRRR